MICRFCDAKSMSSFALEPLRELRQPVTQPIAGENPENLLRTSTIERAQHLLPHAGPNLDGPGTELQLSGGIHLANHRGDLIPRKDFAASDVKYALVQSIRRNIQGRANGGGDVGNMRWFLGLLSAAIHCEACTGLCRFEHFLNEVAAQSARAPRPVDMRHPQRDEIEPETRVVDTA